MNANANTTLSFDEFAKSVGEFGKALQQSAKPLADAYAKATPEQQKDLRARWMLNHIIGQGYANAKAIIETGKGKGAKPDHIKAIDRASSDFTYNIKQGKKKSLPASSGRQVKVSAPKALVKSLVEEIVNSGIDKAEFNALIAELKDSVTFE